MTNDYQDQMLKWRNYPVWVDATETHDLNGKVNGLLETRRIALFTRKIPKTSLKPEPKPPCLLFEVFDEKNSTKDQKYLKPVYCINLTSKDSEFFADFIKHVYEELIMRGK